MMSSSSPETLLQRRLIWLIERLDLIFLLLLLPLFAYVYWASRGFMLGARLFPVYVAMFGMALIGLELLYRVIKRGVVPSDQGPATADLTLDEEQRSLAGYQRGLLMFAWLAGFYALIYLIGLLWATAIFVPVFLVLQFRARWWISVLLAGGLMGLIYLLHLTLRLRWPPGLFLS